MPHGLRELTADTGGGEVHPIAASVRLEEVAGLASLRAGWHRVRANKGSPGGDGMTIATFEQNLDERLVDLQRAVLSGTYRPGRLRRYRIPKDGGKWRTLLVPPVTDRVLQTALQLALQNDLDHRLSEASWAYRPGRGVKNALAEVEQARAAGLIWTVDCDIERYFDTVPHRRLVEELTIWIDDVRIVGLIRQWLRRVSFFGRGLSQGSPISPLLANLYLHPMDRLLELEGLRLIRYADDFLMLCPSQGRAVWAQNFVARHLRERGLALNTVKTRIVPPVTPFIFLGEEIQPAVPPTLQRPVSHEP
jgi:group II intron reverse transcriptase/maturase